MNRITTNKNIIVEKSTDLSFCKNRLSDKKGNKCKVFLTSDESIGKMTCPYGYSCARGRSTTFCGFVSEKSDKYDLIVKRQKNLKKFDEASKKRKQKRGKSDYKLPDVLTEEEHLLLKNTVYDIDYSSICSQTAHDLIHYSGQLKTLVDETFKYSQQDKRIEKIIREYKKYISSIDTYQKNSVAISNMLKQISQPTIRELFEYWKQKRENYDKLINAISDISLRIEGALKDISIDEYKNQYSLLSLISMQSLFDYRIKYHLVALNELMGKKDSESLKPGSFNWHKIAKKLTNILSYQAKMKGISFAFNGNTYCNFLSKENVYLAFYILLENAVKYCLTTVDPIILLSFDDSDNDCLLEIKNASSIISDETLLHITEKGISGENSKNLSSNGIGLFVAKKIFEENSIQMEYGYSKMYFSIILSARKKEH